MRQPGFRRRLVYWCCIAVAVGLFACAQDAWALFSSKRMIDEVEKETSSTYVPEKEETITRPVVRYQGDDERDPFREYVEEQKVESAAPGVPRIAIVENVSLPEVLTVQGIMWGGRFPQAIINNKVVRKGDSLGDVRVLEISKDGVKLFYRSRNFLLPAPAADTLKLLDSMPNNASTNKGGDHEVTPHE